MLAPAPRHVGGSDGQGRRGARNHHTFDQHPTPIRPKYKSLAGAGASRASACPRHSVEDQFRPPPPIAEDAQLESPAWYVDRQRTRPVVDAGEVFTSDTFRRALEVSPLKNRVKHTLLEMLLSADAFGRTTVSGRRLAASLEVREATISSHLGKAREAELLLTQRRFNSSSVHQLTWPGSSLHAPTPGVSPLFAAIWTDGEVAWWNSLNTDSPRAPPWGSGRSPF